MKLIDEKGKLFGLVNIIDLLVCLVLIAVVAAVGYRYVGRKAVTDAPVVKEDVYITVNCMLIPEEAALSLQESAENGDRMVAKNAYQNAEIVSVEYDASDYIGEDMNGNPVWMKHPIWKTAQVVIKDKISPADPIIKVGGQEARIGYKYTVKTQKVEIQGTVTDITFEHEM